MTTKILAGDDERCPGIGSDDEGWYEECKTCLRLTAPPTGHPRQSHMTPPAVITFFCPSYMDDRK